MLGRLRTDLVVACEPGALTTFASMTAIAGNTITPVAGIKTHQPWKTKHKYRHTSRNAIEIV